MASQPYQYTPLSSESSFRLLRLKETSESQRPFQANEIELFEVSFQDAPAFEAVSYAWGHADTYVSLVCNGQQLSVSSVVLEMIKTLNHISSIGTFWIDALCIDQSSTSDKNIQVPRMRIIYSEALRVWIWLGKGSYETRFALKFLVELDARATVHHTEIALDWEDSIQTYQATIREARGVYDAVDTEFLVDLIRSPWFHRTWTIQEVALARSATLVCGTITLHWTTFLNTLERLQNTLNFFATCRADSHQNGISNPAAFFDDIRTYSLMTDMVRHRKSLPLAHAFDLIRPNQSSDPKDKVYGLLGILDYLEVHGLPSVDYTSSVQRLYHDMTRTILQNDQALHILYMIGLRPTVSGLPTWVPDYSNTAFIRFIDIGGNTASAHSSADFTLAILDRSLSVSGVMIDDVDLQASSTSVCTADFRQGFAARSDLSTIDERYAAVTQLIQTLRSWIAISRMMENYPTGEEPSTAFYNIMTQSLLPGSQSWSIQSSPKPKEDVFQKWLSIMTADLSQDPTQFHSDFDNIKSDPNSVAIVKDYIRLFGCSDNPRDWTAELQIRLLLRACDQALSTLQHDVSILSYQRTFFTTRDGYMGVGPRSARPTDRIALIAGLQLPFIVRKAGQNYNLIGPAYIYGVMKGERWNSELAQKITLV